MAPLQPSLPWPPSIVSRPPAPLILSSPSPPCDQVRALVADQRVAEGRAFDVLEPEQLVVAVAARFVVLQRDPDAGPLAAGNLGRERSDVALADAARHPVPAVVAADQVEVPGPAVDDVDPEAASGLVVGPGPAEDLVVAEVADHPVVVADTAVGGVVAAAAVDQVGARAATEQVVAEAAVDRVVALAAPDHVAAWGPVEDVVAIGADDLRLASVAARVFDLLAAGSRHRAPRPKGGEQHRCGKKPGRSSAHGRRIVLRRCGSASC